MVEKDPDVDRAEERMFWTAAPCVQISEVGGAWHTGEA